MLLVWFGLDGVDLIQQHHKKIFFSFKRRIKLQMLVQILNRRHVSSTMFFVQTITMDRAPLFGVARMYYFRWFELFNLLFVTLIRCFLVGYKLIIHLDARLD